MKNTWLENQFYMNGMLKIAMLQARSGENEIENDIIHREIITPKNKERRIQKLKDIARSLKERGIKSRLYVTFNNRSWQKAIPNFQEKATNWLVNGKKNKIKNLNRNYISELQKPESRGSKDYYLVDIDKKDEFLKEKVKEKIYEDTPTYLVTEKETPNGYHMLFQPFDIRILEPFEGVEVKKDAMLLIDTWGFNDNQPQ